MLGSILNSEWFAPARRIDDVDSLDAPQYVLCCRSWISLVADCCSPNSAYTLATAIRNKGLYAIIAEGEDFAKAVLRRIETSENVELSALFTEIFSILDISDSAFIKTVLQVSRFPKRFTPVSASGAVKASFDKFKQVQAEVRRFDKTWSRWPGNTIRCMVADEMRDILIPKTKRALGTAWLNTEVQQGSFSNGSTSDAGKDAGLKFNALVECGHLSYDKNWMHYLVDPAHLSKDVGNVVLKRHVVITSVPKDFASRRLIAAESAICNWNQHIIRDFLIALCTQTGYIRQMDPEYQLNNKYAAAQGSCDVLIHDADPYCSIDLSSASDRIPRECFFSMFPMMIRDIVRRYLPTSYECEDDHKWHEMHMLASSGNVLTPILQCIFFLSICRVATRLAGGNPDDVVVYNDDILVRQSCFQTVCEMLSSFNAVVNEKKTYAYGLYRESCGGEYYTGVDVTPRLWPRRPLCFDRKNLAIALSELTEMQHRFYEYPTLRCILEEEVKAYFPKMTYSPVGSECDDLWASWISCEESMRSPHYHLAVRWVPYRNNIAITRDHYGFEAASRQAYFSFLEHGPAYASQLDKLLGVSNSTTSLLTNYGRKPITRWTLSKPMVRLTW